MQATDYLPKTTTYRKIVETKPQLSYTVIIINLKKVKGFDLGFSGTICVNFQNGLTAYVSRHYVAKIKQVLGI